MTLDQEQDQYQLRILRDGQLYITDDSTRKALAAVHAVDPKTYVRVFDDWQAEGRIRPDHAANQRHGIETTADQAVAISQGHRR
jgi:hypothetical protein